MDRNAKILIVEDEAIAAMDTSVRLQEMGLQVVGPVGNAEDALRLCSESPIDLVLMDVRLSGPMDGVEAAATLRQRWGIPVVFVTAYSDPTTLSRIAEVQPYGYLLKPIDEAALRVTVDAALRRHEQELARAAAEEAKERAGARYREILDHSHDGIVSVDGAQRIIVFNRGAEAIFGWQASEVVGQTLDALIPGSSTGRHRGFVESILSGSVISRPMTLREVRGRRRDGETFPAEVSISRLALDGQPIVTAIVRDISERRRLEAQYQHAQRLDTIGRLASSVAHDFNNQLVPIGGYADLLCRALPDDDPRRTDAQQIRAAADRAAQLTRQLLFFARRDLLHEVPVTPDKLLGDLSGVLDRLVGGDIAVHMDLRAGPAMVQMNPSCFEQIILNLAVNARDAMPDGGRLTLSTARVTNAHDAVAAAATPGSGDAIALRVSDTGTGIDPDVMAHIFEPFFTTKGPGLGTGLGLSTVQDLVMRAGGSVDLLSEAGRGTTFTLILPICPAMASSGDRAQPGAPRRLSGGKPSAALVVDNDDAVRRFAGRVLTDLGYEVTLARTTRQARALCPDPLHLLLTDIVLPGGSSAGLAAELAARTDCDVVFMSGFAEQELTRHALRREDITLLRKPFTAEALEGAVSDCLGASRPNLTGSP